MANAKKLDFGVQLIGDGESDSFVVDFSKDPIQISSVWAQTFNNPRFNLSTTPPSSLMNVRVDQDLNVLEYSFTGTVLTITFDAIASVNVLYTVLGTMLFN